MLKFKVSANFAVTGKLDRNGNFDLITAAKYWQVSEWSIKDLAQHIQKGHPWMPGLLDGERRLQENVRAAYLLTADIDDGWTIEQALCHPFVSKHCALGITSASHSKDHHKFRLVFVLPEAVEGHQAIRSCNETLIDYLEVSDKSCKDASRFYFGSENAQIFLEQDVILPSDWLEQMSQVIVSRDVGEYRLPALTNLQKSGGEDLRDFIQRQIYPRLSLRDAFDWPGHNWNEEKRTGKLKGCCPWHESQSGTSFYAQIVDGVPLWRCPACDIGGDPIAYRDRLSGGNGNPKGKAFVGIVQQLASHVGVELPKREIQQPEAVAVTPISNRTPEKGIPSYGEALDWIDGLEQMFSTESELEWAVMSYIKESGLSSLGIRAPQLLRMARARRDGEGSLKVVDSMDILESGEGERQWLIPGLAPLGSAIIFAAGGGTGKTSFVYDIAKHIATGRSWSNYPVRKGTVLIVQTDEPRVDIQDKLDIANFYEVGRGPVQFIEEWRFTQIRQLEAEIKKYSPVLVVIDSYTAGHAGMNAELTKSSAGDSIYLLRNMAQKYNCTFVVIHHFNKMNELRDSSTLKDNVSEVWSMYRDEQVSTNRDHLVLEISKSRAGITGKYLMQRYPIDYSWQHMGAIDGSQLHLQKVINALKRFEPKTFTPKQLSEEIGISLQESEQTLEQGRRLGLIRGQWRQWTREDGSIGRFRVYNHKPGLQEEQSQDIHVDF